MSTESHFIWDTLDLSNHHDQQHYYHHHHHHHHTDDHADLDLTRSTNRHGSRANAEPSHATKISKIFLILRKC